MPTSNHTLSRANLPRDAWTSDEWNAYAKQIDGAFVVIVKVTAGTYKRRAYFTAQAAQDAARRATARGENATVFLAELKPLWRLAGGSDD